MAHTESLVYSERRKGKRYCHNHHKRMIRIEVDPWDGRPMGQARAASHWASDARHSGPCLLSHVAITELAQQLVQAGRQKRRQFPEHLIPSGHLPVGGSGPHGLWKNKYGEVLHLRAPMRLVVHQTSIGGGCPSKAEDFESLLKGQLDSFPVEELTDSELSVSFQIGRIFQGESILELKRQHASYDLSSVSCEQEGKMIRAFECFPQG